jgi:hypothetical protein
MLKTIKIPTFAPTCFGSCRNHHQGAILCSAKTGSIVLVVIDMVNVMAIYQPVVRYTVEEGTRNFNRFNIPMIL